MLTNYFNSNFDLDSISPISEPINTQINGKKQIRFGMTPEEIADIVSDELMEIVKKSLKNVGQNKFQESKIAKEGS